MSTHRHEEWNQLVGAFVEIRNNNHRLRSGIVDTAMPDSSALWLAADAFDGRTLIEKAEGFEVWVEPGQLKIESLPQVQPRYPLNSESPRIR